MEEARKGISNDFGLKYGKVIDQSDNIMKIKLRNPEINDMHLIWEDEVDLIMMICSNARGYMVYDEQDPEESRLLRRVVGGHQDEITCCKFDFYLSLVATGCVNGEIAIYDFETSNIEGLLRGHKGDITTMEFLSPYPLLISASTDQTVCIWATRPCPSKLQNVCLKRYHNVSWYLNGDVGCAVTRILLWKEKSKGIKRYRRLRGRQLGVNRSGERAAYRNFE